MELLTYLKEKRAVVENALGAYFSESQISASTVVDSMRYSLFAGGKRLRPILCIAAAEAVGGREEDVLPVACALELVHTYSLIHDDLPAMDDDDLRRGRPTNHIVFGEAVALLAGDALLTEAFYIMTKPELTKRVSPGALVKVIGGIAHAAGCRGMIGGQLVDIQSEGKSGNPSLSEFIHTHKTGALITASVRSGVIIGGGDESQIEAVTTYGERIGLAFQISDDILDVEGDSETIGKRVGADKQKEKVTYPAVFGLSRSKEIQTELVKTAIESLKIFGRPADPLRQIASYVVERKR